VCVSEDTGQGRYSKRVHVSEARPTAKPIPAIGACAAREYLLPAKRTTSLFFAFLGRGGRVTGGLAALGAGGRGRSCSVVVRLD
jgi:hypothetical protein